MGVSYSGNPKGEAGPLDSRGVQRSPLRLERVSIGTLRKGSEEFAQVYPWVTTGQQGVHELPSFFSSLVWLGYFLLASRHACLRTALHTQKVKAFTE